MERSKWFAPALGDKSGEEVNKGMKDTGITLMPKPIKGTFGKFGWKDGPAPPDVHGEVLSGVAYHVPGYTVTVVELGSMKFAVNKLVAGGAERGEQIGIYDTDGQAHRIAQKVVKEALQTTRMASADGQKSTLKMLENAKTAGRRPGMNAKVDEPGTGTGTTRHGGDMGTKAPQGDLDDAKGAGRRGSTMNNPTTGTVRRSLAFERGERMGTELRKAMTEADGEGEESPLAKSTIGTDGKVKNAGSRGGQGYYDDKGDWQYGEPPKGHKGMVGKRTELGSGITITRHSQPNGGKDAAHSVRIHVPRSKGADGKNNDWNGFSTSGHATEEEADKHVQDIVKRYEHGTRNMKEEKGAHARDFHGRVLAASMSAADAAHHKAKGEEDQATYARMIQQGQSAGAKEAAKRHGKRITHPEHYGEHPDKAQANKEAGMPAGAIKLTGKDSVASEIKDKKKGGDSYPGAAADEADTAERQKKAEARQAEDAKLKLKASTKGAMRQMLAKIHEAKTPEQLEQLKGEVTKLLEKHSAADPDIGSTPETDKSGYGTKLFAALKNEEAGMKQKQAALKAFDEGFDKHAEAKAMGPDHAATVKDKQKLKEGDKKRWSPEHTQPVGAYMQAKSFYMDAETDGELERAHSYAREHLAHHGNAIGSQYRDELHKHGVKAEERVARLKKKYGVKKALTLTDVMKGQKGVHTSPNWNPTTQRYDRNETAGGGVIHPPAGTKKVEHTLPTGTSTPAQTITVHHLGHGATVSVAEGDGMHHVRIHSEAGYKGLGHSAHPDNYHVSSFNTKEEAEAAKDRIAKNHAKLMAEHGITHEHTTQQANNVANDALWHAGLTEKMRHHESRAKKLTGEGRHDDANFESWQRKMTMNERRKRYDKKYTARSAESAKLLHKHGEDDHGISPLEYGSKMAKLRKKELERKADEADKAAFSGPAETAHERYQAVMNKKSAVSLTDVMKGKGMVMESGPKKTRLLGTTKSGKEIWLDETGWVMWGTKGWNADDFEQAADICEGFARKLMREGHAKQSTEFWNRAESWRSDAAQIRSGLRQVDPPDVPEPAKKSLTLGDVAKSCGCGG